MEKEGKINFKFVVAVLFLLAFGMFVVSALTVSQSSPSSGNVGNSSVNRSINFTFTPTWNLHAENVANCTLWTNYTGTWQQEMSFNGTNEGVHSESANITNGSLSWVNFTFNHDIGPVVWAIACYNSSVAGSLNFTASSNRTIFIDNEPPNATQTADIYHLFNTSDTTPTLTINFSDASSGINISGDGNFTLNISIYRFNYSIALRKYNASNENLTCSPTGEDVRRMQCTVDLSAFALASSMHNITIQVADRAGKSNVSSFLFTVDAVGPAFNYYNFTVNGSINPNNASQSLNQSEGYSRAQGSSNSGIIYAAANWTDNLTRPLSGLLQFFNGTSASWQTLNQTPAFYLAYNNGSWVNLSFAIPKGHNEFEGRNVSFRLVANDTAGASNTSTVKNFTILINDTTAPDLLTINGSLLANGSNISDNTPTIGFAITEPNKLNYINISIDGNSTFGGIAGKDTECEKSASFDTSSGTSTINVESNRNNSITVKNECALNNGAHNVTVRVQDSWSNTEVFHYTFNVESGSVPGLSINITGINGITTWSKSATNNSNITSLNGIKLSGTNGPGASIDKIVYNSSCDTTKVTVTNNTIIYPFNGSCLASSGNRTLSITINDTAGNSNLTVFGFLVDNIAPSIAATNPTNGMTFTNENVSLNLSVKDDHLTLAFVGYYVGDDSQPATLNMSATGSLGGSGANSTFGRFINFNQSGIYTIKFTANDSIGNSVNSSSITFTSIGNVDITALNTTLKSQANATNVTFRNSSGDILSGQVNILDQNFQMFLQLNTTGTVDNQNGVNITVTFNASDANWNKSTEIYFTVLNSSYATEGGGTLNARTAARHILNNQTASIVQMLYVNRSFSQFLSNNNSYFAKVTFKTNASRIGGTGGSGGSLQIYYFADEGNFASKTNVTYCSEDITLTNALTTGLPCWNTTTNRSVDVFLPHFSIILFANDSNAPTINVTNPPQANFTGVSMFLPNISLSADAVSCKFIINGSSSNETMVKDGTTCYGSTLRFKNGNDNPGFVNINFSVVDGGSNENVYAFYFNVSDSTNPNAPNASRVSVSVSTTTATVTLSSINESVNASVKTIVNGSLTSSIAGGQSDYNETQAVSLSGLSASTTYHYNITVCDFAGNCVYNDTGLSFTTSAAETSSSSSSSSSSGSGGGGGGTAATSSVVDSKAQVWSSVPKGSSVTLDVNREKIAITKVTVSEVASDLSNVELEVAALDKNPVSEDAASKVYQYLKINRKNLADTDGSFKVGFRVTNSWLTDNQLASGDVALYRFSGDIWNELTTAVTSSDATYVYYESDTPGFSSFAIGAKSTAEESPSEEVPTSEGEQAPPQEGEKPEAGEKLEPVKASGKSPTAWIIAAVVAILGIVLIVVYQKNKSKV